MRKSHVFSRRWGAVGATAALLGGLLLLNAAAIREIVDARREAHRLARHELQLRLEERGQAYRARLANLRTDLVALAESPPLQRLPERLESSDPLVSRWARLDAQGSLALFVQSHPALREVWLSTDTANDPVKVGRRDGVVLILDPRGRTSPKDPELVTMRASLPSRRDAWIRGWVDLALVLGEEGDPEFEGLSLETVLPDEARPVSNIAWVQIEDSRWDPPIHAWLVARQEESQVERSVAALAGGYRRTVIWNLIVIVAMSASVVMMLLQMRRRARAEAVAENERKIRELERGLLHSERLASVGRFAAGVAHEVNNPLEGLGNYLSLLESDLDSGNTARARERLQQARKGLNRAAAILRRVLSFSDPARAPKEVMPVLDPIEEAVEFLRPRFSMVTFDILGANDEAQVRANRVALSQLFLNILLNACEGQEDGGKIEVAVTENASTVLVTITDHGPGLTREALDHLFEPFYSTRGSSGLGLAVCHGIIQDHGGEINAANRPNGSGAVFEVRLPSASVHKAVSA